MNCNCSVHRTKSELVRRVKNSTRTEWMIHSWYQFVLQIYSTDCAALFTNADRVYNTQPEQKHMIAGHSQHCLQKQLVGF